MNNTIGDPGSADQKGDTTTLHREVRDHRIRNVFPAVSRSRS